jgi:N-acetylneuraminic acid mutarotase
LIGRRAKEISLDENSMTEISVSAPSATCMHSCVSYGDSLYFYGGENSESLWTDEFYSLSLPQGHATWTKENSNNLKRDGHCSVVAGNQLFILGGSTNSKSDKLQVSSFNFGFRLFF